MNESAAQLLAGSQKLPEDFANLAGIGLRMQAVEKCNGMSLIENTGKSRQ